MIFYKLPNPQLLVIILHKKRRYGMTEYNQSWFENIWLQRYEVLINETWRKKKSKWDLKVSDIC